MNLISNPNKMEEKIKKPIGKTFPHRESNPGRLGESQESLPLDYVGIRVIALRDLKFRHTSQNLIYLRYLPPLSIES